MFNGIIFNQGEIKRIDKRKKGINIFIKSTLKLTKKLCNNIDPIKEIVEIINNIKATSLIFLIKKKFIVD